MVEAPCPTPTHGARSDLLPMLGPVDVVLVEGFKAGRTRSNLQAGLYPRLAGAVPGVFAVASPGGKVRDEERMALDLDRPEDWIDAVLAELG